jgi:hypothetical protein
MNPLKKQLGPNFKKGGMEKGGKGFALTKEKTSMEAKLEK